MTITWHGYSCVKLSEPTKEGEVSVIVDPFTPASGEKIAKNLSADVLVVTADDKQHNNVDAVAGEPFLISGPGEYEVKDILVHGVGVRQGEGKDSRVVSVVAFGVGDVRVVYLGAITEPLNEKLIEEIGMVDVLLVPCGGGNGLSPAHAAAMVQELEPRMVVPINFAADGLGEGLQPVDAFLKLAGLVKVEAVAKAKLAKKDLPSDEVKLLILDPQ